jgi:hypothetical protein
MVAVMSLSNAVMSLSNAVMSLSNAVMSLSNVLLKLMTSGIVHLARSLRPVGSTLPDWVGHLTVATSGRS